MNSTELEIGNIYTRSRFSVTEYFIYLGESGDRDYPYKFYYYAIYLTDFKFMGQTAEFIDTWSILPNFDSY